MAITSVADYRAANYPYEAAIPIASIPFGFPRTWTTRMQQEFSLRFEIVRSHPWVKRELLAQLEETSRSFREFVSGIGALEQALRLSEDSAEFELQWDYFILSRYERHARTQRVSRRQRTRLSAAGKVALLCALITAAATILAALL